MYLPTLNLFLTAWLLTSFAGPLQSEPQKSYYESRPAQGSAQDQYYSESQSQQLIERHYQTSIPHAQTQNSQRPFLYSYQQRPVTNSRVPLNAYKTQVPIHVEVSPATYGNEQKNPSVYPSINKDVVRNADSYRDAEEYSEENDVLYQQFERLSEDGGLKNDEILKKMIILAKVLEDSNENDLETRNTIEDRISLSDMPEETKRVARQVRKQKPGFFWTLARVTFETFNDTRSAIQQIGEVLSNYIVPDSTTQPGLTTMPSNDQSKVSSNVETVDATTSTPTETTTEEPYKFSPGSIQSLVRRNLKGLVRLFNIEWKDALAESETSVKEFRKELGNQVGLYLQDNPKAS